ncbi:hypothetical protein VTJ83DRAFT_5736 [Remersonia thermophila]|uniref:Ketohexokinase n=1 Tax=Remersonia thermophila TaxID=72144 RepID=A0ABR4D9X5_9PEZI
MTDDSSTRRPRQSRKKHTMTHLILVGAVYMDTILTVPRFPEEDSKLRATDVQVRRGGNVGNTLEVLAQFQASPAAAVRGLQVCLVACLPEAKSPATTKILRSFGPYHDGTEEHDDSRVARSGGKGTERKPTRSVIDHARCLFRQGHEQPASSYILRSAETGSRTIVNHNPLPEMTPEEFEGIAEGFAASCGEGHRFWWHFEGRIPETTLRCIRHLREKMPGCTISVEVEKPGRDGLAELAAEADVVFYSRSWAQHRGYHTPEACLRAEAASSKASLMCCTWGEDGAGAYAPTSGEYVHRRVATTTTSGSNISVVE